jgi:hypothetical protein
MGQPAQEKPPLELQLPVEEDDPLLPNPEDAAMAESFLWVSSLPHSGQIGAFLASEKRTSCSKEVPQVLQVYS